MDEKTISLTVTVAEINGILAGLARLPYGDVFTLIAKLQAQAKQQLDNQPPVSSLT